MPEPAREVGSEFHWDPAALLSAEQGGGPADWLPARHELFATGCGAMSGGAAPARPAGRLHMPSYFCMGVAEALSAEVPLAWYRHLPDGPGPRLETLRAAAGDVVVAQNLFGRDDRAPWDAWTRAHPGVIVAGGPLARPVQRLGAGEHRRVRRGLAAQDAAAAGRRGAELWRDRNCRYRRRP